MNKRVPALPSNEAAELFLEQDLSDYLDPSHMEPLSMEFERKDKNINLRLSQSLFDHIKRQADAANMPYQRFIRLTLEKAIQR